MKKHNPDSSMTLVRLAKFVEKMPRLLSIKTYVDRGERLCDYEADFLKDVYNDSNRLADAVAKHPQYQSPLNAIRDIYWDVMDRAIINENSMSHRGELSWI